MIYEFERRFSMAHRLWLADDSPRCQVPHGHNEFVRVRLAPRNVSTYEVWGVTNMPVSFAEMKSRWNEWIDNHVDHALQLNMNDPLVDYFAQAEPSRFKRLMLFPGDPTTEALACMLLLKLRAFSVGTPWCAIGLTVEETPTNKVTVTVGDAMAFEQEVREMLNTRRDCPFWWTTANMEINDRIYRVNGGYRAFEETRIQ